MAGTLSGSTGPLFNGMFLSVSVLIKAVRVFGSDKLWLRLRTKQGTMDSEFGFERHPFFGCPFDGV